MSLVFIIPVWQLERVGLSEVRYMPGWSWRLDRECAERRPGRWSSRLGRPRLTSDNIWMKDELLIIFYNFLTRKFLCFYWITVLHKLEHHFFQLWILCVVRIDSQVIFFWLTDQQVCWLRPLTQWSGVSDRSHPWHWTRTCLARQAWY